MQLTPKSRECGLFPAPALSHLQEKIHSCSGKIETNEGISLKLELNSENHPFSIKIDACDCQAKELVSYSTCFGREDLLEEMQQAVQADTQCKMTQQH